MEHLVTLEVMVQVKGKTGDSDRLCDTGERKEKVGVRGAGAHGRS